MTFPLKKLNRFCTLLVLLLIIMSKGMFIAKAEVVGVEPIYMSGGESKSILNKVTSMLAAQPNQNQPIPKENQLAAEARDLVFRTNKLQRFLRNYDCRSDKQRNTLKSLIDAQTIYLNKTFPRTLKTAAIKSNRVRQNQESLKLLLSKMTKNHRRFSLQISRQMQTNACKPTR